MHSPKGIYKSLQICGKDAQIPGHSPGNIHGRYATDGKLRAEANRAHPDGIVLTQELGAYHQQQKIYSSTHSTNQVPGNDSKHSVDGPEATRREDQKYQTGTHHLISLKQPSAHQFAQLLGKLNATTPALQMAPLFCHSLQIC